MLFSASFQGRQYIKVMCGSANFFGTKHAYFGGLVQCDQATLGKLGDDIRQPISPTIISAFSFNFILTFIRLIK